MNKILILSFILTLSFAGQTIFERLHATHIVEEFDTHNEINITPIEDADPSIRYTKMLEILLKASIPIHHSASRRAGRDRLPQEQQSRVLAILLRDCWSHWPRGHQQHRASTVRGRLLRIHARRLHLQLDLPVLLTITPAAPPLPSPQARASNPVSATSST